MKKWHLYKNGVFEGYAPNRWTARSWACGDSNYMPPEIDDKRHIKKVLFINNSKEAVFKEVDR